MNLKYSQLLVTAALEDALHAYAASFVTKSAVLVDKNEAAHSAA